jgi:hypothetical protein
MLLYDAGSDAKQRERMLWLARIQRTIDAGRGASDTCNVMVSGERGCDYARGFAVSVSFADGGAKTASVNFASKPGANVHGTRTYGADSTWYSN